VRRETDECELDHKKVAGVSQTDAREPYCRDVWPGPIFDTRLSERAECAHERRMMNETHTRPGGTAASREERRRRTSELGVSLFEIMIVMVLLSILSAIGVSFATTYIRKERMRSAAYVVQTHMQMARIEALSRNRNCRFTIDDSDGTIEVLDLMDPADASDDVVISSTQLPTEIAFDRPDAGSPISLNNISGTIYETTFQQDGVVSSGDGDICMKIDEDYRRVSVYVAGGVHMSRWHLGVWAEGL